MSLATQEIGITNRVTAVFDNRTQAEQAVSALRRLGVSDAQLSVVARHDGDAAVVSDHADDAAERTGKGALAGAGVGALFGLAALAIPGVGPFVTAGWLASALGVGAGAVASGAIVGGASGAIAGAFAKAGYDERDATYYGNAVEQGGTVVAVDTTGSASSVDQVRTVLAEYGGRFSS